MELRLDIGVIIKTGSINFFIYAESE